MATSLFRANYFTVLGKLEKVNVTKGNQTSDGKPFVSVEAVISANLDGRLNEFPIRFYASQFTQDGKESQLYLTYVDMPNLVGSTLEVNGEIRENRFWSAKGNQMVSAQQLNGKFIRAVPDSSVHQATFEIGGFIVNELVEKTNKANEIYRYDLKLGQSNYNGNGLSVFTLHINPTDKDIVTGVKNWKAAQTVKVTGQLRFYSEQHEVIDDSNAFGAPRTRVITNNYKYFYIDGGSNPFKSDDEGFYTSEDVRDLISVYKSKDLEIQSKASTKKDQENSVVEEATKITSRQTSLL